MQCKKIIGSKKRGGVYRKHMLLLCPCQLHIQWYLEWNTNVGSPPSPFYQKKLFWILSTNNVVRNNIMNKSTIVVLIYRIKLQWYFNLACLASTHPLSKKKEWGGGSKWNKVDTISFAHSVVIKQINNKSIIIIII